MRADEVRLASGDLGRLSSGMMLLPPKEWLGKWSCPEVFPGLGLQFLHLLLESLLVVFVLSGDILNRLGVSIIKRP